MRRAIDNLKNRVRQKASAIAMFSYGIIVGTSAPLLLTRCATGGSNCANCGGFCGLALGILPLVLFITMRSRVKRAGQHVLALVRRTKPVVD